MIIMCIDEATWQICCFECKLRAEPRSNETLGQKIESNVIDENEPFEKRKGCSLFKARCPESGKEEKQTERASENIHTETG